MHVQRPKGGQPQEHKMGLSSSSSSYSSSRGKGIRHRGVRAPATHDKVTRDPMCPRNAQNATPASLFLIRIILIAFIILSISIAFLFLPP